MKKINFFIIFMMMFVSSSIFAHVHNDMDISEPVGSYNNGCLMNAKSLDINSKYYQVYRPSQRRYYGDESLVNFIERYSRRVHEKGIKNVLIGDMSTREGGRLNTGHASHQIGLDVDIEFWLTKIDRHDLDKSGHANILVTKDKKNVNDLFNQQYYDLIMEAAKDDDVERIFVSPAIKLKICEMSKNKPRLLKAIHKIRPWYGHTEHLHVRLKCPKYAKDCQRQDPPPHYTTMQEEIEDARSWFRPATEPVKPKPRKEIVPPSRCLQSYPNMYKHVNKPNQKDPHKGVNKPNGKDPHKGVNKPNGKDPHKGVNKPNGKDPHKDVNKPNGKDPHKDVNKPNGKDPHKDVNPSKGKDSHKDINKPNVKDPHKDVNHSNGKDSHKDSNKPNEKDPHKAIKHK